MQDREVLDLLRETAANLVARGIKPAADAIGQGVALIHRLDGERHAAIVAAQSIPDLNRRIESLNRQIAFLNDEVAKAQAETRLAQVPRDEERAEARQEVRDVLRPFLTAGDTGTRMLALTIRQALDAAWGKEPPPKPRVSMRAMRLKKETA